MRSAFFNTLTELAQKDERIVLLTADLGYLAIEPFAEAFPDRFINVGVAEQNMIGLATGLAEAGFIPFVYSITPFAALRPYEFIRNGPIAHHLPVRIVGVGAGISYSTNGITHYGLEDLGVMRIQPGIITIAPADARQTQSALLATWNQPGPVYISLGKDNTGQIPGLDGQFELGKMKIIASGKDLLIFSIGSITNEVLLAAKELNKIGIFPTIAVISCLNPVSSDEIAELIGNFKTIFTVESHYITGGLGSLIAEIIAESGTPGRLIRCGFSETPDGRTGSREYVFHKHGLMHSDLFEEIVKNLKEKTNNDK